MASWDDLLPLVSPYLQGAPDMSVKTALSRAAVKFLEQTHLWREEIGPFETVVGEAEIALSASATIESVLWAKLGAYPLIHTDARFASPTVLTRQGRPTHFYIVNDTRLRLHPIPDAVYSVSLAVALKPLLDDDFVEDWITDTWADALVDGAVWYLASIPNKHWSDASLARDSKARFDRAIANAKARDLRQINLRVRMRGF